MGIQKNGIWIYHENDPWECSICHTDWSSEDADYTPNYCPDCGSKNIKREMKSNGITAYLGRGMSSLNIKGVDVNIPDTIVLSFDGYIDNGLPLITIYRFPIDYPTKYVARLWFIKRHEIERTKIVIITDSFEEILKKKPLHMDRYERYPDDDPVIMESWL